MKQIVCLSTSPWYPVPTRKQQVMGRLKDAEVLYFDPPVTWIAPLRDPNAKAKLKAFRGAGERVAGHVTAYALPPVLPFFNKYRAVNRRNQRKTAAYVRRRMAEAGFEKPVLWCYSPVSADVLDLIPHSALVYDCVDRHSAYGGLMNPAVVDAMELDLARRADMVFATAESLAERLRTVNPKAMFLPMNRGRFRRSCGGCRGRFSGSSGPCRSVSSMGLCLRRLRRGRIGILCLLGEKIRGSI